MTPERRQYLRNLAESLAAHRGTGPSEAVRLMAELLLELFAENENLRAELARRGTQWH